MENVLRKLENTSKKFQLTYLLETGVTVFSAEGVTWPQMWPQRETASRPTCRRAACGCFQGTPLPREVVPRPTANCP